MKRKMLGSVPSSIALWPFQRSLCLSFWCNSLQVRDTRLSSPGFHSEGPCWRLDEHPAPEVYFQWLGRLHLPSQEFLLKQLVYSQSMFILFECILGASLLSSSSSLSPNSLGHMFSSSLISISDSSLHTSIPDTGKSRSDFEISVCSFCCLLIIPLSLLVVLFPTYGLNHCVPDTSIAVRSSVRNCCPSSAWRLHCSHCRFSSWSWALKSLWLLGSVSNVVVVRRLCFMQNILLYSQQERKTLYQYTSVGLWKAIFPGLSCIEDSTIWMWCFEPDSKILGPDSTRYRTWVDARDW